METQVRTPQMIFMPPQRLVVPLFQRPYVWNEENQWAPLWSDITRVAERLLADPNAKHFPHFLGAVVLQQVQNPTGSMQERVVIDGQQRLTTLQVMLDALHAELDSVGARQSALRLEALVTNAEPFWDTPEDRFKVWPTNRDRPAFTEVMRAAPPVSYGDLQHGTSRVVSAHRFFAHQARGWLAEQGDGSVQDRAIALERSVRELLQLVVIDLSADENAQEIFETLNARGAQLTAADLIKNFVFQRLMESGVDVEAAYTMNWQEFETGFWEAEISFGRIRYSRSSIFLNHWLISRTGEEIVAREVFSRFKRFADHEADTSMSTIVETVRRASRVYRHVVEESGNLSAPVDRLGLFSYRTSTLESEVFKSLLLVLLDPEAPAIPEAQLNKALDSIESWLVRRMLVRASTNSYTQVAAELITQVTMGDRAASGDTVEAFLRSQVVGSRYWPDDDELRGELRVLPAYARLRRARLRMVLEAIEDHQRGWKDGKEGLGGQRVLRGKYAIEHVMPRRWATNWPLRGVSEVEREQTIHRLGNLTLLTGRLNSKVSNGRWSDKRAALKHHDVLKLNSDLIDSGSRQWNEELIAARTEHLIDKIIDIWPVPSGHRSVGLARLDTVRRKVDLADLIGANMIEVGAVLRARGKRFAGRTATVLSDGQIDVDGVAYSSPSGAASAITGRAANGWRFFLVSQSPQRSLRDLLHEYADGASIDLDESESPDDDDDEER